MYFKKYDLKNFNFLQHNVAQHRSIRGTNKAIPSAVTVNIKFPDKITKLLVKFSCDNSLAHTALFISQK